MSLAEQYDTTGFTPKAAPIRALLLDDSSFDRTRIRRMSDKSDLTLHIEDAPTISAMTNLIEQEPFDLIMVDYCLPEGDGLQALNVIQQGSLNRDAAVIMISGDEQSKTAVAAFRQGCHDFVSKKDLTPVVFQQSVSTALERSRLRQFDQYDVAQLLQQQIQIAMQIALEGDAVQSALHDGMQQAAKTLGFETGVSDLQNLLSYTWEDEFILTK